MITRETKLGLVVSCSFLCLVGVVLFSKLRENASGDKNDALALTGDEPKPLARGGDGKSADQTGGTDAKSSTEGDSAENQGSQIEPAAFSQGGNARPIPTPKSDGHSKPGPGEAFTASSETDNAKAGKNKSGVASPPASLTTGEGTSPAVEDLPVETEESSAQPNSQSQTQAAPIATQVPGNRASTPARQDPRFLSRLSEGLKRKLTSLTGMGLRNQPPTAPGHRLGKSTTAAAAGKSPANAKETASSTGHRLKAPPSPAELLGNSDNPNQKNTTSGAIGGSGARLADRGTGTKGDRPLERRIAPPPSLDLSVGGDTAAKGQPAVILAQPAGNLKTDVPGSVADSAGVRPGRAASGSGPDGLERNLQSTPEREGFGARPQDNSGSLSRDRGRQQTPDKPSASEAANPAETDNLQPKALLGQPSLNREIAGGRDSVRGGEPVLGRELPATSRPIAVPLSTPAASISGSGAAEVESYDEETHQARAGDSFRSLSRLYYGSERYERSLLLFNKNHPLAPDGMRQDPPRLLVGQSIYIPPSRILEKHYRAAIDDAAENAISGQDAGTIPSGRLQAGAQVQKAVESGVPERPGVEPLLAERTSRPKERLYRVKDTGEMYWEIARRTLGDPYRWKEIYQLNKTYDPKDPIPGGAEIRLPAAAQP